MSKQYKLPNQRRQTARVLAMLSFFWFIPIFAGIHRLYLGRHISWFLYLCIWIIIGILAARLDISSYWSLNLMALIPILSIIDFLLLWNIIEVDETKPIFMNKSGQYPINNPRFVYVVLGTIAFLSILCFWAAEKIFCYHFYSDYDHANETSCVWILRGNKSKIDTLDDLPETSYIIIHHAASILTDNIKIIGFILLFIGAIIFAWHYHSKSKPALNTQNDEVANALANLKRLYDTGAITEAEYNEKRKKYLDSL